MLITKRKENVTDNCNVSVSRRKRLLISEVPNFVCFVISVKCFLQKKVTRTTRFFDFL